MPIRPTPIIALDVPSAADAAALLDRIGPAADFVKVGLQLFVAEGPAVVRAMRDRGCRVFLDLKFHDIPNTVAKAVQSAAALGVDLLTLHASGGAAMMRAAREAAGERGAGGPRLLAVTVLTSLSGGELAHAWGRRDLSAETEVERLAGIAADAGMDGVVASVHEAARVRARRGEGFLILTPGIRLAGDAAGDQTRVATPADAVRAGADFVVLGRSVTAAADPAHALTAALLDMENAVLEGSPA
ncbi:MAG TPA: orotidine-5'-phosphate decarboxylase [Longimicrobiaceae bacterium]|jgi:orotidine-5'-phosphate decarboxylase|nr:orotidine-5'-phosphate decarboxylase [Longimicrobiaceae bacterium]